ncbi:MAG: hypothetical protein A4E67_00067 [Syntrophaceae bacterium PtaB.Bin038]|nr:MAG: hypothetical protein A4E67_00067 [Syntrophaceae bacterium PtaB.Bin038]
MPVSLRPICFTRGTSSFTARIHPVISGYRRFILRQASTASRSRWL